jgi:hypothetical protein
MKGRGMYTWYNSSLMRRPYAESRLRLQYEVGRIALGGRDIIAPIDVSLPLFVLDAGTGSGENHWIAC